MAKDYISREAALKAIHISTAPALEVKAMPAADVVAVVRCRECKHYDCEDGDQKCVKDAEWDEETACYYGFIAYHGPEFFCADGERKDGGQDELDAFAPSPGAAEGGGSMSVLINMEMPTSCAKCRLFGEYGCPFIGAVGYALTRGERNADCPLISVPKHGRLIDADALRQSIKKSIDECHAWAEEVTEGEMYARVSQALGTFVECSLRVKAAPTIIPSDPAEEGE